MQAIKQCEEDVVASFGQQMAFSFLAPEQLAHQDVADVFRLMDVDSNVLEGHTRFSNQVSFLNVSVGEIVVWVFPVSIILFARFISL